MTGLPNTLDEDDKKANSKDKWDIIKLIAPLIGSVLTGVFGGFLGVYTTLHDYDLKERETTIRTVEVAEKFMPYLIGNVNGTTIPQENREDAKKATIIMIASLDENNLAINLARLYPSKESIQSLKIIILQGVTLLSPFKNTMGRDKTSIETDVLEAIDALGEIAKILISSNPFSVRDNLTLLDQIKHRIEQIEIGCPTCSFQNIKDKIDKNKQELKEMSLNFNNNLVIIISSDTSLNAAQFEKIRAENLQKGKTANQFKGDIFIYKRKGWYATLVKTRDQNQQTLENALKFWRDNFRSSSFMVDFKDWCPSPSQDNGKGFSECK